jgi:hypothetical protein
MNQKNILIIIFVLSLLGTIFSGTLSYMEIFGSSASCPSVGAPGTILGYPACVYGFGMFIILTVISAIGVWGGKKSEKI